MRPFVRRVQGSSIRGRRLLSAQCQTHQAPMVPTMEDMLNCDQMKVCWTLIDPSKTLLESRNELINTKSTIGLICEEVDDQPRKGFFWTSASTSGRVNRIVGMVTERDFMSNIGTDTCSPISSIMTPVEQMQLLPCTEDLWGGIKLMSKQRFRHVPVFDFSEEVIGAVNLQQLTHMLQRKTAGELKELTEEMEYRDSLGKALGGWSFFPSFSAKSSQKKNHTPMGLFAFF